MKAIARFAAATDVGRARKLNEDSYFTGTRIFAVADGLGGHRAGEVASKMAVDALGKLDASRLDDPADALVAAIVAANKSVHDRAAAEPETQGMATTVTALAFENSTAYLAHVGDSRCYLLRDATLEQISEDHTLVAHMIEEGTLTPAQAESHPQRSIVTRALGADDTVSVDVRQIALHPADRLLLCSDGLSSVVPEDVIATIISDEHDPDIACRLLIEEANNRGGPDNITVVLVDISQEVSSDGSAVTGSTTTIVPPAANEAIARSSSVRHRRFPIRAVVWVFIVAIVLFGSLTGVKAWANRSWYVGIDQGKVTIFRGLPTQFVVPLHHVEERTPISTSQIAPFYVERLKAGIRASSLADARKLVEQAPRIDTPAPLVNPAATPSNKASHS
ncbi:MAG: Stp1/IreP family PP2C-type Ser/Thr phosphatase [Actinomycetota bacterium]